MNRPIDVRRVREKLRLTQVQFAERFGFSVDALRNWEQGRRAPERYAQILLAVIDRNPEVVEAVLDRA